ncbi:MAG: cation transporter [Rhodobacteraceae bacterium]|nr:cation transporter [Paracoccaceae bacterium]
MPNDHAHHHHLDPDAGDRRVAWAIGVNLLLTLAQILGGLISGSLALIADAIHNFSDAVSLIVAFAARRIARRPADGVMTFGYGRAEVVAALINYTTLIVIALYLVYEGIARLIDPPGVDGWVVVIVAGVALVVDVVTALLTYRLSKESLNIRAAFLHNVADALGSVAVIVAGTLILLYDWWLVDPIVTLGISAYILWHVAGDIGPVIRILMLGSPDRVTRDAVRDAIAAEPGVEGVHHLHLWQIDEGRSSVEAHLVVRDLQDFPALSARIKARLADDFGVRHATLEPETRASGCTDGQG